jgi:putative polyketide hydroxylase
MKVRTGGDMTEEHPEVLVVGAGLGGLSTAMFLALRGVRVLVVERHADTSPHPRAAGQNPRTMEAFRVAGIADAVRAAGQRAMSGMVIKVVESLRGKVLHSIVEDFGDVDAATSAISPATWGMATQDRVEPIMLARARELGADIRFSTELVSFDQDEHGIRARLLDRETDRLQEITANYLVAADGARSPVRERLGITRSGKGHLASHIGMVFHADLSGLLDHDDNGLYYLQHQEFTGAFAGTTAESTYIFSVEYHPERGESIADYPLARCVELIRLGLDAPELAPDIIWRQQWEMAALVADRWRDGRIFLLGDAAKVTPPTGGLGGNTAVCDGYDLAWKLASVLRGEAGDGLLDSYEPERKLVAELVVQESLHNYVQRMAPQLAGDDVPAPVGYMEVILGHRYRSGAVLATDHDPARVENPFTPSGRPGCRAPHVPVVRDGIELSTVDLFGRAWVLLAGQADAEWLAAAATVAAKLGIQLDAYGRNGNLGDPSDTLLARYGIGQGGASLIRPDGMVAWRSTDPVTQPADELHTALSAVLAR